MKLSISFLSKGKFDAFDIRAKLSKSKSTPSFSLSKSQASADNRNFSCTSFSPELNPTTNLSPVQNVDRHIIHPKILPILMEMPPNLITLENGDSLKNLFLKSNLLNEKIPADKLIIVLMVFLTQDFTRFTHQKVVRAKKSSLLDASIEKLPHRKATPNSELIK